MSWLSGLFSSLWSLATGHRYAVPLACLLWLADFALSIIVILKIPYTEIDWKAYMEQVQMYLAGERDYAAIKGGTGPLVYPAGHVYVYSFLYRITNEGQNIFRAQLIFLGLYMATLALVFKSYIKAKTPLYSFPLVILSKRLHSIYMLRMFNDTVAIFVSYLAIYVWQNQYWMLGSIVYSLALSVKMNVLLFLPAASVILFQALGPKVFRALMYMLQVQIIVAYPFSSKFFISYLTRAFQFNRAFLHKWTVNWRFVDEVVFLTPEFSQTLLLIHGTLLLAFIFGRWIKPSNMNFISIIQTLIFPAPRPAAVHRAILVNLTPEYILKTLYTCNLIGVLCARSLHYQFFSWFAWSLPYLLSATHWNPIIQIVIWLSEEWAWNVYPSTKMSSVIVVISNGLIVWGIWRSTRSDVLAQQGVAGAPVVPPEMASISITESMIPLKQPPSVRILSVQNESSAGSSQTYLGSSRTGTSKQSRRRKPSAKV
ncbi:ALG3 protein-domain-containing protein [Lipomyces oligophaga]|uniref:ALG3 protein-domain-containing protein n=1 Tax=Lipomyces oligophaga TaxID=45792 RepID=UPI0034CF5E15